MKKYNIMLYIAADNNLDPYAKKDLDEILLALPSQDISINAMIDYYYDKAQYIKINPQKGIEIIKELGEVNTGKKETLEDYLVFALNNYKAENNILILWDHGSGFYPSSRKIIYPLISKDIGFDENTNEGRRDALNVFETKEAIKNALIKTNTEYLSMLGFDACLMANLELMIEYQNLSNFFVASEETIPGNGWPYTQFINTLVSNLNQNKDYDIKDLVFELPQIYFEEYERKLRLIPKIIRSRGNTLSSIDLTTINQLGEIVNDLGNELNKWIYDNSITSRNNKKKVLKKLINNLDGSFAYSFYKDIKQFADQIIKTNIFDDNINKICENVKQKVDDIVINNKTSEIYGNIGGISLFLPTNGIEERVKEFYHLLEFSKNKGWINFIEELNSNKQQLSIFLSKGVSNSFQYNIIEILSHDKIKDKIDWGLKLLNVPETWKYTNGLGANVVIIDSGVPKHKDLEGSIVDCINTTYEDEQDYLGHSTHVSGIIGARKNDFGVIGVAPQSNLFFAKIFDENGKTNINSIIEAFEWTYDLAKKDKNAPYIINMSWGSIFFDAEVFKWIVKLNQLNNVYLVAASGNTGGRITYPAKHKQVIAVGSINKKLNKSKFSSYGIQQELMAPGEEILSTYLDNKYAILSGTSMAAPFVSGVLALALSYYGVIDKNKLRDELHKTAIDIGKEGFDIKNGWGIINPKKLTE